METHDTLFENFTTIIENTYTYTGIQSRIFHDGQLTDPMIDITTGVRQGCLIILAVDWIMLQTTTNERNGIQWTLMEQLEDLDFANDIAHHYVAETLGDGRQVIQLSHCYKRDESKRTYG